VSFAGARNAIDLMMWLSNAKTQVVAANKVALVAEQAKDAVEKRCRTCNKQCVKRDQEPRFHQRGRMPQCGHGSGRRYVEPDPPPGGGNYLCSQSVAS